MLASPGAKPFTAPDWIYEIKFDGYRCMARAGGGRAELRTKSGTNSTAWYPELTQALSKLPGGPHVIDGEVCVLDDLGGSDFKRIHERAKHRSWFPGCDPVTLCAFDLLFEDGRNIMSLPLMERKARLARLVQRVEGVVVVDDLPAQAALSEGSVGPLPGGFLAKRCASTYQPGVRSSDWLKIKRMADVVPERFRRPQEEGVLHHTDALRP